MWTKLSCRNEEAHFMIAWLAFGRTVVKHDFLLDDYLAQCGAKSGILEIQKLIFLHCKYLEIML